MAIKLLMLGVLLSAAVLSDLWTYKIRNTITFGFMAAGIIINSLLEGSHGMVFSLSGILLPVFCLIVLYIIRAIGAGDIKLLSAVGAVMGPGFTAYAAACSFICGGIIASLLILIRRNGAVRFKYLLLYIGSCMLSMQLLPYSDFMDKQDGSKFHFSVAVAAGTAVVILLHNHIDIGL